MEVFKYLKSVGLPIIFLLFIFLLDPFSLAIKAGYALIAVLLMLKGRTLIYNIDRDFLVLLAFSITFTMFDYFGENRGIQYLIIQAIFPVFFYALGKMMVTPNLSNKGVIYLVLSIGFIYSVTALLSIVFNLMQGGFIQTDRFIPSFWNGEEIKSTKVASYLIYNTVIPAILVANRQRFGLLSKLLLLSIYGVSLIASFRLGSRTLIAISALSLIASFVYIVIKQPLLDNLKLVATLFAIVVITYIYVPFDFDSPIFSTLGQRLQTSSGAASTASAGNRTVLWAAGLKNLLEHPLGWEYHMHHHNLWLDMAKKATFIPLLFFLINNVFCYSSIKKAFSISGNDIGFNVTLFLFFFSTFLLFFTEPVIEGNFFSIVVYCLILGILNGFIKTRTNMGFTENI